MRVKQTQWTPHSPFAHAKGTFSHKGGRGRRRAARFSPRLREYRLGGAARRHMRLDVVLADDACRGTGAEFDEITRLLAAVGQDREDTVGALRRSRHEDRGMQADILSDRKKMTRQRFTASMRDSLPNIGLKCPDIRARARNKSGAAYSGADLD